MQKLIEESLSFSENGLQMLSRSSTAPIVCENLPEEIQRLKAGKIFEIVGGAATGKTEVLYKMIISCILPKEYDGQGKRALLIDLDIQFSIQRVIYMITNHIHPFLANLQLNEEEKEEETEKIIEICLKRLYLYRCRDLLQFLCTLSNIYHQLNEQKAMYNTNLKNNKNNFSQISNFYYDNENIPRLLVIDNLSSFYWAQRVEDQVGINFQPKITEVMSQIVNSFPITLVYSITNHTPEEFMLSFRKLKYKKFLLSPGVLSTPTLPI